MESFIMSWKTFRASIMVRLSVARSFRSAGDKKKLLRRIRQEEIKRERERERSCGSQHLCRWLHRGMFLT